MNSRLLGAARMLTGKMKHSVADGVTHSRARIMNAPAV